MNKNRLTIGLLILFSLTACKNVLDIDSTRTVGEKNMWNTMEDTRAALIGVYGLTQAAMADNNAHWIYGDLRAAEFASPSRQDLKSVTKNELNASYTSLEALKNWRRWFAVVNAANLFLERAPEVMNKDERYIENNLRVDLAQIRFLRAFAYFYMVRIWGDVPLIISSRDGQFENKPSENAEKIIAWAENEMLAVVQQLPYRYSAGENEQQGDYYNETSGRWDGTLVRRLTAYAVLAHVAAWQQNYQDVATYSQFVMENYEKAGNGFISTDHLTDANGFFFSKRPNHLFGFNFEWEHGVAGFSGHLEELTLAAPVVKKSFPDIFLPKDLILSIFNEPKDERFSLDTLGNPGKERYFSNFNGKYPIFSKVKSIMGGSTSDPSFRIFSSAIVFTRLEDIVLLRAEALNILGERKLAIEHLNMIRTRRGLKEYNEEANGDLLDAIFKERQRELMGEGHRWYDLVRYHRIRKQDVKFNHLLAEGGIYWPIAGVLLGQNDQLKQNQYWK